MSDMCSIAYLPSATYYFAVPHASLHLGPLIVLIVTVFAGIALVRSALAVWAKILIALGFVLVAFVFVVFSANLCGPAPVLVPFSYEPASVALVDLEPGEAALYVARSRIQSGLVVWRKPHLLPGCEGAGCVLPDAGILYRCEAYGVERIPQSDVMAAGRNASLADRLMDRSFPCELTLRNATFDERSLFLGP